MPRPPHSFPLRFLPAMICICSKHRHRALALPLGAFGTVAAHAVSVGRLGIRTFVLRTAASCRPVNVLHMWGLTSRLKKALKPASIMYDGRASGGPEPSNVGHFGRGVAALPGNHGHSALEQGLLSPQSGAAQHIAL